MYPTAVVKFLKTDIHHLTCIRNQIEIEEKNPQSRQALKNIPTTAATGGLWLRVGHKRQKDKKMTGSCLHSGQIVEISVFVKSMITFKLELLLFLLPHIHMTQSCNDRTYIAHIVI